jgi:16S rRNA (cytosine967-C5)-methyltransferase
MDRFPDLSIDALDTEGLDPRDAGLARAIYGVAIRRWLTLWGVIDPMLEQPRNRLDKRAAAALLSGAAQVLLLERVPAHAACHESVEWVKRVAGPGKAKLVNALLRRICGISLDADGAKTIRDQYNDKRDELPLADGRAVALARPVLSTDPLERLGMATSVPVSLLRAWVRQSSMREARRLALHGLLEPPVILNTGHSSQGVPPDARPHTVPGHHVYVGPMGQLVGLLRERSDLWVQDPASSLAVEGVSDLKPRVIVDLCAGMGTKTRQLAATFPEARIVATDIDRIRLQVLGETFKSSTVEVTAFDEISQLAGLADLVLLDVPCSNTGVLARRVEARYRFDASRQATLVETQRQIIANAIALLSEEAGNRGGLLYSTCSLDPCENEEQAHWATRWHGLSVIREHRRMPEGGPGDPPEAYSDGSYAVLMG